MARASIGSLYIGGRPIRKLALKDTYRWDGGGIHSRSFMRVGSGHPHLSARYWCHHWSSLKITTNRTDRSRGSTGSKHKRVHDAHFEEESGVSFREMGLLFEGCMFKS